MYSIEQLQDLVKQALASSDFKGKPDELYEPIAYTMAQEGKRMRPVLLLLSCDLFGGDVQKALKPSLAIELFHNFTLIHDDIMDKAPLRRGMETVYKKWNENIAILSGDTTFALAYSHLIQADEDIIKEIIDIFNRTAIEVCEGQQYDMNFEKQDSVTISDYLNMIRLKTAVLLGCAMKIGSIIASAAKKDQELIYDFGVNLGIAFQLKDDYLDAFGDMEKFGKKPGGDIAANKKTYLLLKAMEIAEGDEYQKLSGSMNNSAMDENQKINTVIELYRKLGIDNLTKLKMNDFYIKAVNSLNKINVDDERKSVLRDFAKKLMERDN